MSVSTAPAPAPARPTGTRSRSRLAPALIALAVLAVAAAATLGVLLKGKPAQTAAELGQQRAGLVLLADEVLAVRRPVAAEVAAARAVWPAIAHGLPARPDRRLLGELTRASAAVGAVPLPRIVNLVQELTGPAPRLARAFHSSMLLTQRGFGQLAEDVEAIMKGPGPAATFARANAGLYIASVYDGMFTLSLLGEKVLHSYERLGAEAEFGSALTATQVEQIEAAYSAKAVGLIPHDIEALSVQK